MCMKEMLVVLLKWLKDWPIKFIKRKFLLYYSLYQNKEALATYKTQWSDKFLGLRNIYEAFRFDLITFWGTKFYVFLYVYFPSLVTVEEEEEEEEEEENDEEALEEEKNN